MSVQCSNQDTHAMQDHTHELKEKQQKWMADFVI